MTPDSVISVMRSLPSRVRSPTPANTEVPPKFCATRWIISWISTVLPTPAPPNRPILPPTTYGVIRSSTLMPVSSISVRALELVEPGRLPVDAPQLAGDLQVGVVQALAERVEHVALDLVADRHRDRAADVGDLLAADHAVGGLHGDGADQVVTQVLGDLQGQLALVPGRARRRGSARCRARGTWPRGNSMSTTGPVTRTTRPTTLADRRRRLVSAVAVISSHFLHSRERRRHRRSR